MNWGDGLYVEPLLHDGPSFYDWQHSGFWEWEGCGDRERLVSKSQGLH